MSSLALSSTDVILNGLSKNHYGHRRISPHHCFLNRFLIFIENVEHLSKNRSTKIIVAPSNGENAEAQTKTITKTEMAGSQKYDVFMSKKSIWDIYRAEKLGIKYGKKANSHQLIIEEVSLKFLQNFDSVMWKKV